MLNFTACVTYTVHNDHINTYLLITFVAIAAALLIPTVMFGELSYMFEMSLFHFDEWTVLAISVIGV